MVHVIDAALIALGACLLLYALFVVALLVFGRRDAARAVAGFVPDCVVLVRRLLADYRVPRWPKLLLLALVAYLIMPLDLVPDVIPVAGQLDDAVLVALVLRAVIRSAGPDVVREHWPGPPSSLGLISRLAGTRAPTRVD
jgi:uncharacterized membrane protein YkvA (DUF1232 family)